MSINRSQLVTSCKSAQQLSDLIRSFTDENGLMKIDNKFFDANKVADCIISVINKGLTINYLPEELGIRNQTLFLINS